MVRPNGSVIALDSAARGLAESPFIPNALSLAATRAVLLQRRPGSNLSIERVRDNWGDDGGQRLPVFGSGNGEPAAGAAAAGAAAGATGFGLFGRGGLRARFGGKAGLGPPENGVGAVGGRGWGGEVAGIPDDIHRHAHRLVFRQRESDREGDLGGGTRDGAGGLAACTQ